MEQQTLKRLNALADHLQALYEPIDIAYHTAPVNQHAEQQELLVAQALGKVYNPQFTYHAPPADWDSALRQFLQELRPEDNPWERWMAQDVGFNLDLMRAAVTHDPELITTATIGAYGEPSEELVHSAYAALADLPTTTEPRTVPAADMAAQMQQALTEAGLTDWSVLVLETMSASMSVRSVDKQVKIRAGHLFTPNELKRLLVHEIGTHVFRAVNGELQPLTLLRFGFYSYMLTEEGLANYHEARYGVQTAVDQRRYALRVIAASMSLTHSFYDVFCELVQHTTPDEAFNIVSRAKRGFTDTSVPGCHVKDKVYFDGFRRVSAHLAHHPEDYFLLMSGKGALEMLPMLQELRDDGLLLEPTYLPEHLVRSSSP